MIYPINPLAAARYRARYAVSGAKSDAPTRCCWLISCAPSRRPPTTARRHRAGHTEHQLLAVNIGALVRLTHAVLPGMLARGRGSVVNVASTIAFQPGPYQATYGASKAFALSLSQAPWAETRGTGVTVTALCPGPTRTGFVEALGSDVSHTAIYRHLAEPELVVATGLRALDRGHAVVVPGWRNRVASTGGRLVPGWLSAIVSGRMLRPATANVSENR